MMNRSRITTIGAFAVAALAIAMAEPAAAACTTTNAGAVHCYKLVDRTSPSVHAPRTLAIQPRTRQTYLQYKLKPAFVKSWSTSGDARPRQFHLRRR